MLYRSKDVFRLVWVEEDIFHDLPLTQWGRVLLYFSQLILSSMMAVLNRIIASLSSLYLIMSQEVI